MSVVMSPSEYRTDGTRDDGGAEDKGKVRVHRISSRYPAIEVRTRMDSYVHAVQDASSYVTVSDGAPARRGVTVREYKKYEREEYEDDDDDDDEDGDCSDKTLETAAGCSSASDTDFYYEDCRRGKHTTVIEIRAEEVNRTEAVVQEEFEDSLQITDERYRRQDCRTTEVVTKHRHVLAESCRVKVQNLRYLYGRARGRFLNRTRADLTIIIINVVPTYKVRCVRSFFLVTKVSGPSILCVFFRIRANT